MMKSREDISEFDIESLFLVVTILNEQNWIHLTLKKTLLSSSLSRIHSITSLNTNLSI
jgi:hypothetical protein